MIKEWNENQKRAFSSLDGSVLVSAAAGSGKSAVLVERVLKRLCDEKNVCPADRLMIVTFTRAAASELRHKINRELGERIRLDSSNTFLRKQQRLLSSAVIGTMDSFCGQLVRDNFWLCEVEPDFRVLDNSEERLLMQQAVDNVLDGYYTEKSEIFTDLLELFGSDKNDRSLIENIFNCYYYSMAYPFPDKWISSLADGYDENVPVSETASGKAILDDILMKLECAKEYLDLAVENASLYEETEEKYLPMFLNERDFCLELISLCKAKEWDSLLVKTNDASSHFETLKRIPKDIRSQPEIDLAVECRKKAKSLITSLYGSVPVLEIQHKDDVKKLRPVLECFIGIVKKFSDNLFELKREKNAYGFSDISHMALSLLVDENGKKTELAKEISDFFTEILIDEYQDTNEAQEKLFSAISKDEKNLFVVGDVKQSIYRFRKAMPEIFMRRRGEYNDYDDGSLRYPVRINLDMNYRSRKSILDTVNFIFVRLMNEKTGEINYSDGERLNYGAKYEDKDVKTEIHYLKKNADKESMSEGEHIAREIEKMLSDGVKVKDRDTTRDIKLSDICVLMRSVKRDGMSIVETLRNHGIPAVCEVNDSFCDLPEIRTVLSLLRAVDNPLNDIALLATMFSPIFGFTPDELAEMRLLNKDESLYNCLRNYSSVSEKAKHLLDTLSEYKTYSVVCSAGEMLRRIFFSTNYDEIVRAMPNGEARARNLLHLLDYAERFEDNGSFSLADFLRFIDRVTQSGGDLESNSASGVAEDAVRIMTIHKSKGLEFPVVFLAGCNKGLIHYETNPSAVLLNPKTKIGVKRQDRQKLFRYSTVPYVGTRLVNKKDDIAEELRVFYVALTRARERLIFVIRDTKGNTSLNVGSLAMTLRPTGRPHPNEIISMSNYAKWVLTCALTSSGCENMRNEFGIDLPAEYIDKNSDFISFTSFEYEKDDEEVQTQDQKSEETKPLDREFASQLEKRMYYVYPYERLATVAAKRTASELNEQTVNTDYFASEKPAFMGKGSFTPAERGTLTHLFMEKCDFSLAESSIEKELACLTEQGIFTPEQSKAVSTEKLSAFFSGDLYNRIKASPSVSREKQFTVSVNASEFDKRLETDEQVVVQGKIDCFFEENGEIVIVDYKTDFVRSKEELSDRYKMQMLVYKTAAEQFTDKRVKEVLLYSFALNGTVECDLT